MKTITPYNHAFRPRIIGTGSLPFARAFEHVADALDMPDVLLGAAFAGLTQEPIPDGSIVYNMEPLHDGCRAFEVGYLETLRRCHVLDYQRPNVDYLASLGVEAFHLPFGYHPSMERCKPVEKDIDVLMVGSMSSRRMQILNALILAGANVRYVLGYYDKELDDLVARAKVHVNVHRYEGHPLEVVRLNYLMANAECVITEAGWDEEETKAYADGVVFCAYDDIVRVALALIKHPVRGEIGCRAQQIVRSIPFDTRAAREWLDGRIAVVDQPGTTPPEASRQFDAVDRRA